MDFLSKHRRSQSRWLTALLSAVGFSLTQLPADAQSILTAPPVGYGGASAVLPAAGTNQAFTASIVPVQEPPPLPDFLKWGPVDLRPHLLYRFIYGNGIENAPGQTDKTIIQEVYPGGLLELGRNWTIDYTPTVRLYSSRAFQNTVDQAAILTGSVSFEDWVFNLSQSYTKVDEPSLQTGFQTEQDSYVTGLYGTWAMNSVLSLQVGLSQAIQDAGQFQSIKEWTTSEWLDYRVEKGLSVGLGVTLGYDDLSQSPHETFEEVQGRLQWAPGPKFSAQVTGGIEDRQLGGGSPDLITPIFGATISYQAFEHTRLSANVSRSVSPSLFQDQVLTTTAFGASLSQGISRKLSFSVDGSYANSPYQNVKLVPITEPLLNNLPNQAVGGTPTELLTIDRVDNQWTIGAHLTWAITDRGSIDFFYTHSENSSGLTLFQYSSVQMGFSLGYRF